MGFKMKIGAIFFIIFVNFGEWRTIFVNCKIITAELCGQESVINLAATGVESSVTVLLNPKNHKKICKLNITAPDSHVVIMQWHEANKELLNNHAKEHSQCPLSVFLSEESRTPVWKGDPCVKDTLPEVDLLTPQLRLLWTPPRFGIHTRGRKLIVTAVAQDNACKEEGLHVCMRIGWKPMLCISDQLVCDGNPNCPKGSPTSDEDTILCKSHLMGHTSWKQIAEEVIKKLPPGVVSGNWLPKRTNHNTNEQPDHPQLAFINWKDVNVKDMKDLKNSDVTTNSPDVHHHHDGGDSVSTALTHYGPWGYLMLGMLICGTILMFCGLWECCFRKPKPQLDLQSRPQPTTVLIINRSQDDSESQQPPSYDDLDQPPSYMTLFPNYKLEVVEPRNVSDVHVGDVELNQEVPILGNGSDELSDNSEENDAASERLCNLSNRHREHETNRERRSSTVCIVTDL